MFIHLSDQYHFNEMDTIQTETGQRYYISPKGLFLPSVTSVIGHINKNKLNSWVNRVGYEESERVKRVSSLRGSLLHEAIEKYLLNDLNTSISNHPNASMMFGVIKNFLEKHINKIHALENPLYSEILRVAGRVDCIAEWDGKLSVIDFKTSSKEKKKSWIEHYFIQASAYAVMFYEMFGVRIDNLVILMISNDGTVQIFEEKLKSKYIEKMYKYVNQYYEDHEHCFPEPKSYEQKRD